MCVCVCVCVCVCDIITRTSECLISGEHMSCVCVGVFYKFEGQEK